MPRKEHCWVYNNNGRHRTILASNNNSVVHLSFAGIGSRVHKIYGMRSFLPLYMFVSRMSMIRMTMIDACGRFNDATNMYIGVRRVSDSHSGAETHKTFRESEHERIFYVANAIVSGSW